MKVHYRGLEIQVVCLDQGKGVGSPRAKTEESTWQDQTRETGEEAQPASMEDSVLASDVEFMFLEKSLSRDGDTLEHSPSVCI